MYTLIIIWQTGERSEYEYSTREQAEQGERNMRVAFGNQIEWTGINERR